jgi:hypothetical protein
MVKSGTRKKTNDLLTGCLTAFTETSHRDDGANRMSRSAQRHQEKPFLSIGYGGLWQLNLRHGSQMGDYPMAQAIGMP